MIPNILLFLIVVINLCFSILPFILLTALFTYDGITMGYLLKILFLIKVIFFFISFLFCVYIILDIIFGFSLLRERLKVKHYRLSLRYGSLLKKPLEEIRKILHTNNIKLMISSNSEVRSYIIASMGRGMVCLTTGLLDAVRLRTENDEEFQQVIKAIIVRETISLTRGDYFPKAILRINNKITGATKGLISLFFKLLCGIITLIPLIGEPFAKILRLLNVFIEKTLSFVNNFLMFVYSVVMKILYRNSKIKLDTKTAEIVGGQNVALALSLTQKPDFKIFSTKRNINKRIKAVKNMMKSNKEIKLKTVHRRIVGTIIILFTCLGYLGYDIKIWRIIDTISQLHNKWIH
jgi:hypothetical protein